MKTSGARLGLLLLVLGGALAMAAPPLWDSFVPPPPWTREEQDVLRSLWIAELGEPPADPSNRVSADPRAARLGHRLFFDTRLSAHGDTSCASCHQPARRFTDGRARGEAIGRSARNTMSLVGAAWSPWFYWDGRRDSLWSQALAPLEDPAEHGADRMSLARLLTTAPEYRSAYQDLFGAPPDFTDTARFPPHASPLGKPEWRKAWHAMNAADRDRVDQAFANLGKAIAAYERLLVPGPSRFDTYVQAVLSGDEEAAGRALTSAEIRGLRLFIGEARCLECHNGPLFTNFEFHNTGLLSTPRELPDLGRGEGLRLLLADPFNCLGPYSDAPENGCAELRYVRRGIELIGAQRTPSLRNLAGTAPYMHKGQIADLAEALEHYNRAPDAMIGHNEAEPLSLSRRELGQLEAFLRTLDAPAATAPEWLSPPAPPAAP